MKTLVEKVYKASLNLSHPLNEEDTYETIIKDSMELADAQFGSVFLINSGVLERVYASDSLLYTNRARKKGFTYKSLKSTTPSFVSIEKIKNIHPGLINMGIKVVLYLPLYYRGKAFGVIALNSTKRKSYTDEELQTLKIYASMASLAIKKTELLTGTKQALEIRDFFISTASHELRTPLTAISGYAQLLHKKMNNSGTPESRWIEKLVQETNRLTILTTELLEVNRIRAGLAEYILKEHSLVDILQRTISRLQYHHPSKKILFESVVSDDNDIIVADYDKLVQVFYNLLDNAVKYSSHDQNVSVSVFYKKPYFQVKIDDRGKGISQERLQQIFEGKLHQVDDGTEKAGMGLGLFLVKNIIEKHNGLITIKSSKNKGTTVTVKLPKSLK